VLLVLWNHHRALLMRCVAVCEMGAFAQPSLPPILPQLASLLFAVVIRGYFALKRAVGGDASWCTEPLLACAIIYGLQFAAPGEAAGER